ncbi:hypothetical protein EVG20_g8395 [Dentipellis fragilis]|uniref:Uncharacterized protein n=1 Tax=Dentipellis fragilis TaxID=205917 RepID=A0A4Y9Y7Q3_9AGAM|nr:hypothetical protein EVG20_g8395 [Dentipellis fragilis]
MSRRSQFLCSCMEGCKGIETVVSRSVWERHAQYRKQEIAASFSHFLAGRSATSSATGAGAPSSSQTAASKRHREASDASGASAGKQRRVQVNDSEDSDDGSVRANANVQPSTERTPSPDIAPDPLPDASRLDSPPPALARDAGSPVDTALPRQAPVEEDGTGAHSRPSSPAPDPGSFSDLEEDEDEPGTEEPSLEEREAGRPSLLHRDAQEPTVETVPSRIEDFNITEEFISALRDASLDNDPLPADVLDRLRHPPQQPPDFSDPALRLSIKIHLALTNGSQESYNLVREALHDELQFDLLSFSQVKSQIAELSGVIPIVQHMCVNTCVAFTGPFADRDTCPICQEPRYDQHKLHTSRGRVKSPRQVFHTMPLGPQLQARRRHPEMAEKMQYRDQCMREILASGCIDIYDDLYCGTDLLDAMRKGQIASSDSVLFFSIDGAQLYQSKASDCWIYIWILLDLAPDVRYKKPHVLPGGIIPGPNKPKNLDSFLFPGLHHLAALQREGLQVWDAAKLEIVTDHPFLDLIGADTPGMAALDGMVGPQGRLGCRFYCDYPGRRKHGGSQYYPACLKPLYYDIPGCNHADVVLHDFTETSEDKNRRYLRNLQVVRSSRNQAEFRRNRLETGICKPTIFSGLHSSHRLHIPACFPPDLMHLASLNLTDLLLGLWRGVIDCDPDDDKSTWDWMVLRREVWINHGKAVGAA